MRTKRTATFSALKRPLVNLFFFSKLHYVKVFRISLQRQFITTEKFAEYSGINIEIVNEYLRKVS